MIWVYTEVLSLDRSIVYVNSAALKYKCYPCVAISPSTHPHGLTFSNTEAEEIGISLTGYYMTHWHWLEMDGYSIKASLRDPLSYSLERNIPYEQKVEKLIFLGSFWK